MEKTIRLIDNLKYLIARKIINVKKIMEITGVTRMQVSRYLSGESELSLNNTVKIAHFLEVKMDDLLFERISQVIKEKDFKTKNVDDMTIVKHKQQSREEELEYIIDLQRDKIAQLESEVQRITGLLGGGGDHGSKAMA